MEKPRTSQAGVSETKVYSAPGPEGAIEGLLDEPPQETVNSPPKAIRARAAASLLFGTVWTLASAPDLAELAPERVKRSIKFINPEPIDFTTE